MDNLSTQYRASGHSAAIRRTGKLPGECGGRFRIHSMARPVVHERTVEFPQTGTRFAQLRGTSRDQVEHGLGVAGLGGHRLQHVDCRRLLFDPFAIFAVAFGQCRGALLQFAIRFGAADGDHRLLGEGLQ